MPAKGNEKNRMVLMVAVVLWISAAAMVFFAMRFRMKPLLLVGAAEAVLALLITFMAVGASRRR